MDWAKLATIGSAVSPWTTLAGGILGAAGTGIMAYQQAKKEKIAEEKQDEMFDWKKKQDNLGQINTERQLGQNTLQMMRGSFKDALYRALTRG